MHCPFCRHHETQVKDSRSCLNNTIRRRRLCSKCRKRFTTFERLQLSKLYVIKKSGMRKIFEREKISKSISTALQKRPVTSSQIEEIVDDILRQLNIFNNTEISTHDIGEIVMLTLAKTDQIAYVRFASVYKDFTSIEDFTKFIKQLT